MKCKLTPQLSSDDWKDFCSRFHFSPADLPYIKAIYTALLPLVESCAYYSLDQNLDGIFLPHYAYGFVTLGNGIDELSELYLNHEQIQEAYIVDCVSLLLLSKAYAEFAHVIEDQSGLSLAELSFLGDTYSLDLLPQIYERLAPDAIGLTEGQMLLPLKTAALILPCFFGLRGVELTQCISDFLSFLSCIPLLIPFFRDLRRREMQEGSCGTH